MTANATKTSRDDRAAAILSGLNAPQRDAVLANDGPVLILAGAGSGKTRTITHKIAYLVAVEGYRPWEILAVTFTNKAAGEMRERCHQLMGPDAKDLWLGTFHSIGVRLLRRHAELVGVKRDFVIYDADDQKKMVGRVLDELGWSQDKFPPRDIAAYINEAKQLLRDPGHRDLPRERFPHPKYAEAYALYEQRMRDAGAVDFADLIMLPVVLMQTVPMIAGEYKQRWRYIVVDEFQDTNHAQYEMLRAALNDEHRLCVVGDDDQSIYRWRGADVTNILDFDQDFPSAKVIRLEQNYRSSGNILRAAGAVIAHNRARHGKTLWTDRGDGASIQVFAADSDRSEAEWVARRIDALQGQHPLEEMAIFYRTNAQSRAFEDALRRRGLAYEIVGGTRFYERAEIKDVMGYLRVAHNPNDAVSLARIINTPPRGIGRGTTDQIETYARDHGKTLWDATVALAQAGRKAIRKKLQPFVELVEELRALGAESTAYKVAHRAIERSGYLERLADKGTDEAEARADNVRELLNAIMEYADTSGEASLAAFLDQVSLVSDLDSADLDAPSVAMMTGHTAKGLEFDVAFVTGLEEGLLPHANSLESGEAAIEEERRLAYVMMTRARHHLHLSWARTRRRYGQTRGCEPSRFLEAVPSEGVEHLGDSVRRPLMGSGGGGGSSRGQLAWSQEPVAIPSGYVDEDYPQPSYEDFSQEPGLGVGSLVFHPEFGEGRIQSFSGHGKKAKCIVEFPGGLRKRIIAKFLTPA